MFIQARSVLLLAMLGAFMCGCSRSTSPTTRTTAAGPEPVIAFDTGQGTGPYDEMTYARYSSEMAFTPSADITARAIRPDMWYCNGASGFLAFVRDEHEGYLDAEAGLVDGSGPLSPTFSDRHFDAPLVLRAGTTYLITMEVWTTKSVGIHTTGSRTAGIAGPGSYVVNYAHSDTADHLDRGAIAFKLIE